jgi:hypothetical protein
MLGYMTSAKKPEKTDSVPAFFQQDSSEALRLQTGWLIQELGVDDRFFAKLTGRSESDFARWRRGESKALPEVESSVHDLWRTVLHLLSLFNFDSEKVGELFHSSVSSDQPSSGSAAPWQGLTLQKYLEQGGREAVAKVESWVTGLRFGDPVPA